MSKKKYTIESHIPIPGPGGPREGTSEFTETLLKMNVGDSFIYARYGKNDAQAAKDRSNLYTRARTAHTARNLNRKILTRILMDGDEWVLRIWRIL
jgi:hypothetical protein